MTAGGILFYVMIVLCVLGIISIISGIIVDDSDLTPPLFVIGFLVAVICGIVSLAVYADTSEGPRDFETNYVIENRSNTPKQIRYLQHVRFHDAEMKTDLIMPMQAKHLKNVKVISTVDVKFE